MPRSKVERHEKKAPRNAAGTEQGEPRTAFERVLLARHPERPYTLDFVERLWTRYMPFGQIARLKEARTRVELVSLRSL